MRRLRLALLAAAVALAAAAAPAAAQYDPAFRFRTITTPHFEIHFHEGEDALAQEVAREAERAHAALVPLLGHAPARRTQVVLSDDTDDANGSATTLPYNTIRLYAVPPSGLSELNDFRSPLATLVIHEYVHVLHLDSVGGLPGLGNRLFGRVFFPNGLVPAWITEGLAVAHEAEDEGVGRNASALFDMYVRALAAEGEGLPPLDALSNPYLEWPRGQLPYLLGGRFLAFLRARSGDAAVAAFVRDQGAQLWPYAPSWAGRRAFGASFPALWDAFREETRARVSAQLEGVRARGATVPARLTRRGGRVTTPRWSPDGRVLAYFHASLDERAGLWRVDASGRPLGRGAVVESNGTFTLRSARSAIAAIGEVRGEFRFYDDLYEADLATGERRRLTDGERATDPDLGRDGRTLVYVVRPGPGRLALVRRDLATGARETLLDRPGALPYAPRLSPDGRRIALELHEHGRRDLVVWEDGVERRITDDDAIDATPAWSADGATLFFSSDRGGIYNLYAWDAATGAIRQVTDVETGALEPAPSPDGRTLAFVTYGRDGYDLATIPLDPGTFRDPLPAPPVPAAVLARHGSPSASPSASAPSSPSRPYTPWRTLAPTWWFPFLGADADGLTVGAATSGRDVLGRNAWALQGWWGLSSGEPGYLASYLGGWSWPRLDLASARFVTTSPGYPDRLESEWTPLDAGLGFTFTRVARSLGVRLGWSGTRFDTLGAVEPLPHGVPESWLFEDGFLSELTLTASYSDARRYARSISAEEGRTATLGLRLADPGLGSDFSRWLARGAIVQYAGSPRTHVAAALRLSGGVAEGSLGGRAPFRLGGIPAADPLALAFLASTAPPDPLRGYEAGAARGNAFVLANAELRFPLAAPELGRGTWPVFLRRLHGAVFVDAGDAFELVEEASLDVYRSMHRFRFDALRFGAGVELRAETAFAYHLLTDVRLGFAHGLGRLLRGEGPGDDEAAVPQLYLTVGSAF